MVIVLPPGEMQPLICEGCKGTTFTLKQEVRDGRVDAFHTLCTGCGKRGALTTKVVVSETRQFDQFMDPPEGWTPSAGYRMVVPGEAVPAVTTTTWTNGSDDPPEN